MEKKCPDVVYFTSRQFGDILAKGYCYLRNEERMKVKTHRTNLVYLGRFHFHKKKSALKRYLGKKLTYN